MTDKYCPRNEMKKLEAELWNLKIMSGELPHDPWKHRWSSKLKRLKQRLRNGHRIEGQESQYHGGKTS
ncbi:hypothetical protein Tco_1408571 [Tanacetum coccineum]